MRVSIVSAYYGNLDMTKEFIDNILSKTADEEVIIVSAGNDREVELDYETPDRLKFIKLGENISFSNSMNAGIKEATGDYIIVIGNDGFPKDNDWIDKLITAQQETGAWIVCPTPDRPNVTSYNRHLIGELNGYPEYRMFPAICWLIPRICIEKVGYFDEIFIGGCYEDDDYCRKVKNEGKSIIRHPDVHLHHKLSQTFGKLPDHGKIMQANYKRYINKWSKE